MARQRRYGSGLGATTPIGNCPACVVSGVWEQSKISKSTHRKGRSSNVAAKPARSGGARRQPIWLHGRHAVRAALANPARRLHRLLVLPELQSEMESEIPDGLSIFPTDRSQFVRLLGDISHQGMALLADPLMRCSIDEFLAEAPDQSILIALDHVTDPRNVGAVLRAGAAFGVGCVVVTRRHVPEETSALARAASGALERVAIAEVANLAVGLDQLSRSGYRRLGFSTEGTQQIAEFRDDGRLVLVLGAEGAGLRRLTRQHCDHFVRLPTRPAFPVLNIAAAAACALMGLVQP